MVGPFHKIARKTGRELGLCGKDHEFGLPHVDFEWPLNHVKWPLREV